MALPSERLPAVRPRSRRHSAARLPHVACFSHAQSNYRKHFIVSIGFVITICKTAAAAAAEASRFVVAKWRFLCDHFLRCPLDKCSLHRLTETTKRGTTHSEVVCCLPKT